MAGLLGLSLLVAPTPAQAAGTYDATVVAGDGTAGVPVDHSTTKIGVPWGVTFDPVSQDMYLTDGNTCRVSRVTPAGDLTVIAGSGGCGVATPGTPTRVGYPYAIARHNGSTYIGDYINNKIRRIDPQGSLSSISGPNYGIPLSNEPLSTANIQYPSQFVVVGDTLYMSVGRQVAKVDLTTMQLTPVAGDGLGGGPGADGPATQTSLGNLTGVAVAADGTVYISDGGNNRIYRVTPNGTLSTVTTTTNWPSTLAIGPTGELLAGFVDYQVVEVDTSATDGHDAFTTVAGTGLPGTAVNGPALSSPMSYPQSMAYSPAGDLYVANYMSPAIVKLTPSGPTAPQPPTLPVAQVGDESAAVGWTAPVIDGGSPVTSYTVQAYSGGNPAYGRRCTATAPAVTCTVSGLTNGVTYTYRVTATNAIGTGTPSAASPGVMALGPPDAPTVGTASSSASGDATLTWTAPVDNGGTAVTSYTVQAYAGGVAAAGKTCSVNAPALTCTVSTLTNGTAYTLRVKATTGHATGPESADSSAVTPVAPAPPPPSVPGIPGTPTARAGTSSIAVSWPASSGPVTGYTAVASPGGNSCSSSTTSCVIGAEAGRSYTVTVSAQGPGGSSGPSSPSSSVTPAAPVAPPAAPDDVPLTLTTDKGKLSLALPLQKIVLIGTGYAPNSTVKITIYSEPVSLGTVTTDGNGAFSLPTTVPAAMASGEHTFLAQGVDTTGTARQMALPVTVPPTSPNTTGRSEERQNTALPVPSGGGITLLNASGAPATTVTVPGQGTYSLNTVTGLIMFVPVTGFTGRATPVKYRITDSVGSVVTGSYTAVVTASGSLRLTLPARLVTKVDGTALVRVAHEGGVSVTLWSTVGGKRVSFGSGNGRTVVPVPLNALGRTMTARPGGYPVTVTATTGTSLRTSAPTRIVLQHFALPRSVHFATDSATARADRAYLSELRGKLSGVRVITCTGWTDDRGTAAYARKLSAARAQLVCGTLATGLGIRTIVVAKGKAPTGNGTEAGKARNRRADITLHY